MGARVGVESAREAGHVKFRDGVRTPWQRRRSTRVAAGAGQDRRCKKRAACCHARNVEGTGLRSGDGNRGSLVWGLAHGALSSAAAGGRRSGRRVYRMPARRYQVVRYAVTTHEQLHCHRNTPTRAAVALSQRVFPPQIFFLQPIPSRCGRSPAVHFLTLRHAPKKRRRVSEWDVNWTSQKPAPPLRVVLWNVACSLWHRSPLRARRFPETSPRADFGSRVFGVAPALGVR